MTAIRFPSDELVFLGPASDVLEQRFPFMRRPLPEFRPVSWLEDRPRQHASERRSRSPITQVGYRKGLKPANAGKKYPATPPTPAEMLRLLDSCGTSRIGLRNRALFATLWRTGLRISEALALLPHEVDHDQKTVTVLSGKGGKRRVSGIDDGALREITAWLEARATLPISLAVSPLFCTVSRPSPGGPLGSAYVRERCRELAVKAGIPHRVAPHQLRHSHAVELARERTPLHLVQRQLGHSDLGTTATYLSSIASFEAVEIVAAREWPGAGA